MSFGIPWTKIGNSSVTSTAEMLSSDTFFVRGVAVAWKAPSWLLVKWNPHSSRASILKVVAPALLTTSPVPLNKRVPMPSSYVLARKVTEEYLRLRAPGPSPVVAAM